MFCIISQLVVFVCKNADKVNLFFRFCSKWSEHYESYRGSVIEDTVGLQNSTWMV